VASVREEAYELLRAHGLVTVFGNPGSTELPFLAALPDDFRYVLGLQEAAVVAMAAGFARARGGPALVNLHTAPGVGHALGALFNARQDHDPLVVVAGQQARAHITVEATLTNRDVVRLAEPHLKWAFEPPRAADVPHALARAIATACAAPPGPVLLSVPMDDWTQAADTNLAQAARERRLEAASVPARGLVREIAKSLASAQNPALVAGPELDSEAGHAAAVALAELLAMAVYAPPATGGSGIGFPESHQLFRGVLPPAIGPLADALRGHDLVLVAGSAVFPYYPYLPGRPLPEGCRLLQVTCDPDAAARAIAGKAFVADAAETLAAVVSELRLLKNEGRLDVSSFVGRSRSSAQPVDPATIVATAGEVSAGAERGVVAVGAACRALRAAAPPDTAFVVEAPSATLALRNHLRIDRPRSWFFTAGGGLGFGVPAAVGVKLAQPDRPVVAVVGEGSLQYTIQALWTAVREGLAVVVVVLRNDEYSILKWFGQLEGESEAPGLDLPGIDCLALARGYGLAAEAVEGAEQLHAVVAGALARGDGPLLVEVPVERGMAIA